MINYLSDIITYVRRIIKSPSNAQISDSLIIDYINRFWMMDVDARLQLFDLKTKYQFMTDPTVDQYNMPLYSVQTEPAGEIGMYPVYQGFLGPAYINGIPVSFHTQKNTFFNVWLKVTQQLDVVIVSDGRVGPYTFNLPILEGNLPIPSNPPTSGLLRGHVDITGITATGVNQDPPLNDTLLIQTNPDLPYFGTSIIPTTSVDSQFFITTIGPNNESVVVQDSGQFLPVDRNEGLLMVQGKAPFGNQALSGGYGVGLNTVNYITGQINVQFPVTIPAGNEINVSCVYFESGLPRTMLFYNNTLTLRAPPDRQYLVELEAYLSPAAFFSTAQALPFAYMGEYIARGAARKILADTGDMEQFQFYEPLFREQEMLVWKRSQRQFTATRTETIYSQGTNQGFGMNNNSGGTL